MTRLSTIVSVSLLSADFTRLGEEVASLATAGSDWLHFDVMDNHFVPNLTFGAPICQAIRQISPLPLDVHLMTKRVETLITPFAQAGANLLTFHPEAVEDPRRIANSIQDAGMQVGIALNPGSSLGQIDYLLDIADLILIMTVCPGFGGQSFIYPMLEKISALRHLIDKKDGSTRLQVDGGINEDTAKLCRQAGADTLVSGSYIFNAPDYTSAIRTIRGE